jgi:general secretion pathway protein I
MSPRTPACKRRGLSLMEVLVALAIFLMALVVLGRLVIFGSDHAVDAQYQIQAADLCQAKLAEVIAGAVPLSSQADVPFNEDPNWLWSLDCENTNYPGLWSVTVRVSRQQQLRTRTFCKLTQMVLDPQMHGSVQDIPPDNSSGSNSSTTGNAPSRASKFGASTALTGGGS